MSNENVIKIFPHNITSYLNILLSADGQLDDKLKIAYLLGIIFATYQGSQIALKSYLDKNLGQECKNFFRGLFEHNQRGDLCKLT